MKRLSLAERQLPLNIFNLNLPWGAVLFPLSMSSLSDNSSKASFTASFRPRNLEKELSWVVISFALFASIISPYSLPWEREDEKTSKRKISCEPKREIKNKIYQSKKVWSNKFRTIYHLCACLGRSAKRLYAIILCIRGAPVSADWE